MDGGRRVGPEDVFASPWRWEEIGYDQLSMMHDIRDVAVVRNDHWAFWLEEIQEVEGGIPRGPSSRFFCRRSGQSPWALSGEGVLDRKEEDTSALANSSGRTDQTSRVEALGRVAATVTGAFAEEVQALGPDFALAAATSAVSPLATITRGVDLGLLATHMLQSCVAAIADPNDGKFIGGDFCCKKTSQPANSGGPKLTDNPPKKGGGILPQDCNGRTDLPRIYFTNGISVPLDKGGGGICGTLKQVANTTCCETVGLYNGSQSFLGDLTESAHIMMGMAKQNVVRRQSQIIVDEITAMDSMGAREDPLRLFCHSEGGLITQQAIAEAKKTLAAKGVKDIEAKMRRGVCVTSMGTGDGRWPKGPRYTHFVCNEDLVPVGISAARGFLEITHPVGTLAKLVSGVKYDRTPAVRFSADGVHFPESHTPEKSYLPFINRRAEGQNPQHGPEPLPLTEMSLDPAVLQRKKKGGKCCG